MTGSAGARALADIRRASLEEERDLLLRSLDDLEVEFAAGDLDPVDYESLRDAYTARAADVLRQLGGGSPTPVPSAAVAPERSRSRRPVAVGLLLLFAVVAGVALAQAVGERGVDDVMTGGIDPSSRTRVLECQDLGAAGGDLVGALRCFDEILAVDPQNGEALTYRGWYLLLAAGSLQQTAADAEQQAEAEALIAEGLSFLDRAIAADTDLPDPLAFRAVVQDRLGDSAAACADVTTLRSLEPPQILLDLTADLAERNGC